MRNNSAIPKTANECSKAHCEKGLMGNGDTTMKNYKWIIKDRNGEPIEWAVFLDGLGIPMIKCGNKPIMFDTEKEINSYMRKNHLYQYNGYYKIIIKVE